MKPSEALKIARKNIADDVYCHICNALPLNTAGNIVRAYINSALYGQMTYKSWLYCHHPKIARKISINDGKQGRLQWIDWMIEQYEGMDNETQSMARWEC